MFPELGASNTTLDATDITNIDALYKPVLVAGTNAAALLAQAMASFNTSSLSATTPTLTPPPEAEPALAASSMH